MSTGEVYKWSAIDRISSSILTFGGNIVLARLLDPTDFGLLAMVAIFVAIATNISSCGISDGLIHKLKPTNEDYSTAFTINSSLGFFFGVLFVTLSGSIANWFGHQELKGIMIAIGICIFFQTMSFVQETKLRKELNMKKLAIVKLAATSTSLIVGLILVFKGFSYWGLVSTRIFLSFFQFLYAVIATRWFPRFKLYKKSFDQLFGYGINLMVAYIVMQCTRSLNVTILGKFAPTSDAGLYSQAQKLQEVPFSLTEAIFNASFFPIISNVEKEAERTQMAIQMHRFIVFINSSIASFLIIISSTAITLIYGDQWIGAIPIFQFLVLFGCMSAIKYFYQTILKVKGLTKIIRNLNILELILQIVLLFIFYNKGLIAVVFTQIIAVAIVLLIHMWYFHHLLDVRFGVLLPQIMRILSAPFFTLILWLWLVYIFGMALPLFLSFLVTSIGFIITFAIFLRILDYPVYQMVITWVKSKVKFSNR